MGCAMNKKIISLCPLNATVISTMIKGAGLSEPEGIELIDAYHLPEAEIIELVKDAEIILGDYTFNKKITREIAAAAHNVKLIQQPSVGYQHIDFEACAEAGVPVANTAGANTTSVAEHTIMAALCLVKRIMPAHHATLSGEWKQMEIGAGELAGKLWGLVGMGRIGRAVSERLAPFEVRMAYHDTDRLSENDEKKYHVEFIDIKEMLRSADIISLHCPLTDKTKGLIGKPELSMMKKTALIINVARGEIIDEPALAQALKEQTIGGAALDVFAEEPINKNNPFIGINAENLILTPHIAGATYESKMRIISAAIKNIVKVLNGEKPDFVVNAVAR
jgi:phosphoglycerate dehydrogenase-like enzyme